MTARRLWQGLALFALALYGGIAWTWFAQLVPAAGGQTPFDGRLMGYTAAEGQAYLDALSWEGRQIYLNDMQLLDTLFPIALSATLIFPMWRLEPKLLRILVILPLGYLAADLIENMHVRWILLYDVPFPEMFAAASTATTAKFTLLIASVIALGATYVTTKRP
jgi:hypothetical protein